MGFGCWAIGGPWRDAHGQPLGWGKVDDQESTRALHEAFDAGVTFYDTADVYGAGHSERVVGAAFAGRRDKVVIASKWGNVFDENTKVTSHQDCTVSYLHLAVDNSLRRLNTDYIDVYQLHLNMLSVHEAAPLQSALEDLVAAGKIRSYGWSTDDPERVRAWASMGKNFSAVQHDFSVLNPSPPALAVAQEFGLASINRGPLAMGLLTGKYNAQTLVPADDIRGKSPEWMTMFSDGVPSARALERLAAVRDVLTSGGRTLAQGAIGWLWARSDATVPIPGARTPAQAMDNAGALAHGPLTADECRKVWDLVLD
jgi:aryl-alcohol dehydrogenase-like predicted oxidoreductase